MQAELSIGAFSRMTFLSVKALRHYHEIGLLAPARVDAGSGYRHYSVAQLPIAQVIRRLRDLGMPLGEIATIVRSPDVDTRNAAIIAHLRRMEGELERTRSTVASLRALLEHGPAAIAVEYRGVSPETVIASDAEIAIGDVPAWLDSAFGELRAAVDTLGLRRVGADAALFASELLEDERGDLVAFVPVAAATGTAGRVRTLPATEYAVAVHRGSFEDLDQTFGALGAAVAERAIGVQGPIRENYLVGAFDTPDETRHRTEICWPVFQIAAVDDDHA
jgi:DNA-binding transcriptional MerR regulator/effector-binding domain-containing protein